MFEPYFDVCVQSLTIHWSEQPPCGRLSLSSNVSIMTTLAYPILLGILLLAGCSYSGMNSTTFDPVTGKMTTVHYSRFYEAEQNLPEQKVRVSLVADTLKKNVPGIHELQTSIGALGPSDLYANASFFAVITNYSTLPVVFRATELSYWKQSALTNKVAQKIPAGHQEIVQLGFCQVDSYATNLTVRFDFAVDDETHETKLILERLTYDELEKRRTKTKR